jgi:hypothetical protein
MTLGSRIPHRRLSFTVMAYRASACVLTIPSCFRIWNTNEARAPECCSGVNDPGYDLSRQAGVGRFGVNGRRGFPQRVPEVEVSPCLSSGNLKNEVQVFESTSLKAMEDKLAKRVEFRICSCQSMSRSRLHSRRIAMAPAAG